MLPNDTNMPDRPDLLTDHDAPIEELPKADAAHSADSTQEGVELSSEAQTETEDQHVSANELPSKTIQNSFAGFLFDYVEMFAIALCCVLLIFMFAFRLCDVRGESMEKTLYENEKLLVTPLFYTPERGDIIIFHQTGSVLNEPIVKRVIATGGEWIDIEFQTAPQKITIRIYDENMNLIETLDESEYAYLDTRYPMRLSDFEYPMQIPEGYLFVLGDNRNHSTDSRSHIIGLVDERRVLGKVLMRLYPISVAGKID